MKSEREDSLFQWEDESERRSRSLSEIKKATILCVLKKYCKYLLSRGSVLVYYIRTIVLIS